MMPEILPISLLGCSAVEAGQFVLRHFFLDKMFQDKMEFVPSMQTPEKKLHFDHRCNVLLLFWSHKSYGPYISEKCDLLTFRKCQKDRTLVYGYGLEKQHFVPTLLLCLFRIQRAGGRSVAVIANTVLQEMSPCFFFFLQCVTWSLVNGLANRPFRSVRSFLHSKLTLCFLFYHPPTAISQLLLPRLFAVP